MKVYFLKIDDTIFYSTAVSRLNLNGFISFLLNLILYSYFYWIDRHPIDGKYCKVTEKVK
jgi:hypothetical protein